MGTIYRYIFLPFGLVIADIKLYYSLNQSIPTADFESRDAQFGPDLTDDFIFGELEVANPIEACVPIQKANVETTKISNNKTSVPIVLIKRGNCPFEDKVSNAQNANFLAAIVYDNVPDEPLIPMGAEGKTIINIPSVFTSQIDGQIMKEKVEDPDIPNVFVEITDDGGPGWPPEKFLLPFALAVGTCLLIMLVSTVVKLVRDWRKSRRGRLSRRKLNQLPIIKFNMEQHADIFDCCAICLEDFRNGDKIRELPCKHGYHKSCIDPWLTSNRKVCPLCKRTVLPSSDDSDVSESEEAPLLENEVGASREESPRLAGVARGLAVGISSDASGHHRISSGSSSTGNRRQRSYSEQSDVSYNSINGDINNDDVSQVTDTTTVTTVTSIVEPTYEIRRPGSSSSSNYGDTEETPTNEIL